jgi:hypothetical protein
MFATPGSTTVRSGFADHFVFAAVTRRQGFT